MITDTIRAKIKAIKIHTKRFIQAEHAGDYLSAFKGSGLEFDQLREYHPGDDIRNIAWGSSAKMNKLMVKEFIEERDRTIILCVDVSASNLYGSGEFLRNEIIAEVGTALTFIGETNKDKIGALFFSTCVEAWIPPKRGSAHISEIVQTLFTLKPKQAQTDPSDALKFLIDLKKRNAVVFMLSDWIFDQPTYRKFLKISAVEYDFIAVRFLDNLERYLPNLGLLEVEDPETGLIKIINTSDTSALDRCLKDRLLEQKKMFNQFKIDVLDIPLNESFYSHLTRFFRKRIRKQI